MRGGKSFELIFLCTKPIDFRKGIFSLSLLVSSEFQHNPLCGALFLFTNKSRNNIKALYWDKTGFALWQKVLEKEKFPFPKKEEQKIISLTAEQFEFLLHGIEFWKFKPHEHLNYSTII